jgi:hypothetical protein
MDNKLNAGGMIRGVGLALVHARILFRKKDRTARMGLGVRWFPWWKTVLLSDPRRYLVALRNSTSMLAKIEPILHIYRTFCPVLKDMYSMS